MASPTIDKDGNFYYSDGSPWEPYVWKKGDPDGRGGFEKKDAPDESRMIAELLLNEVLFPNSRKYVWEGWDGGEVNIGPATLVLFVSFNDTFDYACSDSEPITMEELPGLYNLWKKHDYLGCIIWGMEKREQKPIGPWISRLKDANLWKEEYDKY